MNGVRGGKRRKGKGAEVCYVLGGDTSPSETQRSDPGCLMVLRVQKRGVGMGNDRVAAGGSEDDEEEEGFGVSGAKEGDYWVAPVYARMVRNASAKQWSGIVHQLHQAFNFKRICLDHGGGGQWVAKELRSARQEIEGVERKSRPICRPDDTSSVDANFILCLFNRGDKSIQKVWPDAARGDDVLKHCGHAAVKTAMEGGIVAIPNPVERGVFDGWLLARREACTVITQKLIEQMSNISALTTDDGLEWLLTKNGALQFESTGKKDILMTLVYAYTAFLVMVAYEQMMPEEEEEDAAGCWA